MPRSQPHHAADDSRPAFPAFERMERESDYLAELFDQCAEAAEPRDLIDFG